MIPSLQHLISRHWPVCNRLVCGLVAALAAITTFGQVGLLNQGLPSGVLDPRPGLNLGRFNFHGGISTTFSYDDLVEVNTNGVQESDFTANISPFLSAETEGPNDRLLQMYYRPGFLFFLDHSEHNAVNHSGRFNLRWPLNRLTLSLAQNVAVASTVVRDVGNRAVQATYSTMGTADYDYSERTSLQLNVTYDRFGFDGESAAGQNLVGSQQWGEQIWGDYHWGPKLSAGMGVAFSQLDVEGGPFQMSIGPEWRVKYAPTPQLLLSTSVGLQFRSYDSDQESTMEPVLRVNGSYEPRPGTLLTLEAHRAELASGLHAGQNYVDTGFTAMISQVFLRRFTGTLGGSYTMADYVATEEGVLANRTDSYYSLRSSVNWSVMTGLGMGVFYERTVNDSNGATFNFDHNVVGLQANWSF